MSDPSTADIFVSYASHDRPAVHRLVDALTAAGYAVWFDRHCIRGGDYFATEIARGLKGCRQFVLACSPTSLKSDNVHDEFAMAKRVPVPHFLPVWLTRPDRLPDRYELQLGKYQYIETAGRPEAAWLADVFASVRKAGIPVRPFHDLPTTREAFWASVRGQQWEDAVRHGRRLLSADPADAHAAEAVGRAEGWRTYQEQQLVTRLASTRDPEEWWQAARTHPTAAWAEHALFNAAAGLPVPRLPALRAECEPTAGSSTQVVVAIIDMRTRNPRGAVERLEAVLRTDPFHTAALHYRTVAEARLLGWAGLMLEQAHHLVERVTLLRELAPSCGWPDLFAAEMNDHYYHRRRLASPLGSAAVCRAAAARKGMTAAAADTLRSLLHG